MFSDKARWIVAVVLRVAAAGAAAVAAVLMAMSHETVTIFNMEVQAKFGYTPSLVFFVAANAAASACSVVVLLVPTAASKLAARLLLMADVVLGMVLTGAVAAAGAIAELGKHGNSHAGWMAICEQVPVFCDRVRSALVAGSVAIVLYYLLLMYSIYTLPMFP
ncbi:CASP-like protein 1C1-1 [Oryza brachyantha]|uniref:CASP-like protein 1C1-1 n=1 Tax=Oryza brachyantha TaxID=4533 RepID=UPI0003EAAA91|nr:CASP-like protein 1C1-1 [Oryza brachyantha]